MADVEEYVMGLESDLVVLRESGQPSAKAKANKVDRLMNLFTCAQFYFL